MPGSSKAREEGDFFPSFLSQSPPDPVHEHTPDPPKRSLTPRGHIFRDFTEAHRNITGNNRLKTSNPFATPTHGSSNDIPLQDLSNPSLPNSGAKMLGSQTPRPPDDFVLPYPQRSDNGRSLTDPKRISRSSSFCASTSGFEDVSSVSSKEAACEATDKNTEAGTAKSTIGKLLTQYVEPGIRVGSSHGTSDKDYVIAFPKLRGRKQNASQPGRSQSISPCQKLSAQTSFHGGSLAVNYQSKPLHATPTHSVSPKKSISDSPDADVKIRTRPSSHADVTITESDPSFMDEDALRYLRHGHHSLLPMPLRVPSDANDVFADPIHEPGPIDGTDAFFEDGEYFESRSDPFKYDSREYRAALQASREREVSRALEVGAEMDGALAAPGNSSADKEAVSPDDECVKSGPRQHLGQSAGNFCDSTTLDALRGIGPKPPCDEADIRVIVLALQAQGHVLNNEEAQNHLFGRDVKKDSGTPPGIPNETTKEGDWVTEATSEIEVGTGATAPSSDGRASCVIKATGSSVADVSDHESDGVPLRRFNSRNHILRHPPGAMNTSQRNYNVRDLKHTDQRVMVPRPNFPRVNGFVQNSLRIKPDGPPKPGAHPFPPSMRPQIPNPFTRRRSGYHRAGPNSYFTYARDRTKSSKYDFRDSASSYGQASTMNRAAGDTYGTLPSTSMGSINTQKVLELANTQANPYDEQPEPTEEVQKPALDRARNIEDAYFDPGEQSRAATTVSLAADNRVTPTDRTFPFPLLDLREAQEIQRKQRESGNADETEDSTTRYQRAMSGTVRRDTATMSGTGRPDGVTPTQVQQPRRAYIHRNSSARRRASTLSSNFSPPAWLVSRESFHDTPTPTPTAGRHGSMTPITTFDTASSRAPRFQWFTVGQPPRQPRLLPVDKSARRTGGHAVDEPSISDVESGDTGNISPWGCQRRKQFFYITLVMSILPFFGVMALYGSFNTLLASYTEGKVFRFTKKQRKAIKSMLVAEAIIYVVIAVVVILVQFFKA
ncbi:hypothetical protein PGQ11_012442 [Apiospora arundinis]|uniref:Uncharacterized protein n=1 Tax=Apiospora arundinis TaxID=335852 RepID=A0ABR2I2H1_9PEZI